MSTEIFVQMWSFF